MLIIKKRNKLGYSKAYQLQANGKLKTISWMEVRYAIENGVTVAIKTIYN